MLSASSSITLGRFALRSRLLSGAIESGTKRYYSKKDDKNPLLEQQRKDEAKDAKFISQMFDEQFPPQNYSHFYHSDPLKPKVETQYEADELRFMSRKEVLDSIMLRQNQEGLDTTDYSISNFFEMEEDDEEDVNIKGDINEDEDLLTQVEDREYVENRREELKNLYYFNKDKLEQKEGKKPQGKKQDKSATSSTPAQPITLSTLVHRYMQSKLSMEEEEKFFETLDKRNERLAELQAQENIEEDGKGFNNDRPLNIWREELLDEPINRDDEGNIIKAEDEDEGEGDGDDGEGDTPGEATTFEDPLSDRSEDIGLRSMFTNDELISIVHRMPHLAEDDFVRDEDTELQDTLVNQPASPYLDSHLPHALLNLDLLKVGTHTRITKNGRVHSFSALVLVGDQEGVGGIGYGKGETIGVALARATRDAKMRAFSLYQGSNIRMIPNGMDISFRATKIRFISYNNPFRPNRIGRKQMVINPILGLEGCNWRTYGRRGWRQILNVFQYALPDAILHPDELSLALGKKFVTRESMKEKKFTLADLLISSIPKKNTEPYNFGIIGKFMTDMEQPADKKKLEMDNLYSSIREMLNSEMFSERENAKNGRDDEVHAEKRQIEPMSRWKRQRFIDAQKVEDSRKSHPKINYLK